MYPKDVSWKKLREKTWPQLWAELKESFHRLSWFRTAPRRQLRLKATIRPVLGGEFKAETFDISTSGVFISLEKVEWLGDPQSCRQNLMVGSRCMIRLMIDQFHVIHVNAEIVRHSVRSGTHPEGFALRFVCLEADERRILNEIAARPLALKAAV